MAGSRRVRTIFFGSGRFAVPVLDALLQAPEIKIVGVVSVPDRPVGRRAELTAVPVAERVRQLDLALLQPERVRAPEAIAAIAALDPELGILADYGQLIPPAVLDLPRHGILNVHPSLLPRHRGASPIAATISAGDREAGVTLIRMDAGLDSGPIVASESWPLDGSETAPGLERRAAEVGADLLRRSLAGWLAGSLPARPQPSNGATLSRPLRREDGRLDPTLPAVALERRVRAHLPWPGSFVESDAGRLIVWRAAVEPAVGSAVGPAGEPAADSAALEPGMLIVDGAGLALATGEGSLHLVEVQLAGGRRMTSAELLRGHPELVGERVR